MLFHQKNKFIFFYIALGFVVVVFLLFYFYKDINNKLVQAEVKNVHLSANQQQATIDGFIATQATHLASMSQTLLIFDNNPLVISEYLQNLERNLGIDTVVVADAYGIGLLSNLNQVDVLDSEVFQRALHGEVSVTAPYVSRFTGEDVIAAGHPMLRNGKVVGVVLVEYSIDFVKQALISLVDEADKDGYTVLVDGKGNILTSTLYAADFASPFKKASFEGGLSYEKFMAAVTARSSQGGGTVITMGQEKRIVEYRPIHLRKWSIIVVSEDVSNTLIRKVSNGIQYIIASMAVCFLFFLLFIMYFRYKGVKNIESVAFYDELTGLPNMVSFREQVKALLEKNPQTPFVMLKMDIKDFKAVNELFGHDVGNRVLCAMAKNLQSLQHDNLVYARAGADTFFLFASKEFLHWGEKERLAFEAQFKLHIPELSEHEFGFRYGRYVLEEGEKSAMQAMNKATMAHHMAKHCRENTIYEYDTSFKKRILRMAEITNKRKGALENKEFKVYLQPKIDIFQNKIQGAEALVRWIEADGKMVFPDEFIPLFEKNGFIVHLDMYILRAVCRQIKVWLQAGYTVVPISVNFSRMHLHNPNFVQELSGVCDSYGSIRQYIEIELTESAATENITTLAGTLAQLRQAGFSVAIDDFGAGYSSLGMLKNFTVNALKLDKSFFDDNKDDSRGDIVVQGIIHMAKSLGMKVVAEGIETAEQVEFLKSIQCEIVQGYYFAKPMPLLAFEQAYMGEYHDSAR